MRIGFVGLGVMGKPMALRLARAGVSLVVWNRRPSAYDELRAAGAEVASDLAQLFQRADIVIVMLANADAVDAVLQRGTAAFATYVAHHTVVLMGTTSPDYSSALEIDVRKAGGRYVEAPVSGSQGPAERGELVAMLAGDPAAVESIRPSLTSMCGSVFTCGAVPNALRMKFAVNVFLIATVTGLAEASHFARSLGLPYQVFLNIIDAGPMASAVSRMKTKRLAAADFTAQAAVDDVAENNTGPIVALARERSIAMPLTSVCNQLFRETQQLGHGRADMIAVDRAIEARSELLQTGKVR